MLNFIYPNIRTNPDYKFDEVLSGYNYNFTLLENSINPSGLTINGNLIVTGSSLLNSVSATTISATTFYGDGSQLTGIPKLWTDGGNTSLYPTGFGTTTSTGFASITAAYNSSTTGMYGSIWGGIGHTNNAWYAVISGGYYNSITSTASNNYGFIGGGKTNTISGTARHGVILGGELNKLTAGNHSAIVGGVSSTISNQGSFIGGGSNHTISWNYSGLIGGRYNTIHALYSFQGGSYSSDITGWYSGIVGGIDNNVTGYYSGIFGGRNNTVTHANSIALGGSGLTSTADDTVYVPHLNIGLINTGSSVDILTIDNNGNILTNPDLIINNFYTTGATLSGNSLVFDRNDSLSAYSVNLSAYSFNRATDVLEDYSGVQDTYLVERKGVMDAIDLIWSSTIVEDFDITDIGGDLIINYSGTGKMMLRESPTEDSPLRVYSVSSSLNTNVLPNNKLSYIYVDRNSGSPIISHTVNIEDFNCMDKCLIYLVTRYDSTNYAHLYIGKQGVDANRKYRRKLYKREFLERVNGLILNSISLYPTLTAGDMWFGYEEFSTVDFDTTGSNTFTYAYYNGTSWVRNIGQSTLNNTVYNNGGTLTTMTNNRYKVEYVYLIPNKPDLLYVIYGDSEYTKIDDAEGSQPPTNLPPEVTGMGILVGRYIILKNSTSIITQSAFDKLFRPSGVIEHNNTGNLNTGDYLHLTGDEYNEFLNIKNSYLPLTGGTLSGSITAVTYYGDGSNLTGINNFYTTGVTLSGNSLVFDRNDSLSAYSVDLSSFSPDLSGYIPYVNSILTGNTDRIVQVDSGGTVTATTNIIQAYLLSGSTTNLLDDVSNWDINGVYTGTTISNTYQGQKHYNSNYFFEAVDDNIWIRLIRG